MMWTNANTKDENMKWQSPLQLLCGSPLWCAVSCLLAVNVWWLYLLTVFPSRWGEEEGTCRPLRLAHPPLPVTALASAPGSGNTWLRHLLQQVTGLATGSVYNDTSLRAAGFLGEGVRNGSVLVVKTHATPRATSQQFQRAVLLMRNPYDVILAEFNRRHADHLEHASEEAFANYWDSFVPEAAEYWQILNSDWLDFQGSLYVIHYDDLVDSPGSSLGNLLNFLNVTFTPGDLQCAEKHSRGKFKRPERAEGRASFRSRLFTSQHRKLVDQCAAAVAGKMSHKMQWQLAR